MKRKFMSALLIVAATCFTVSCEKDDKDNQSNTNSKFSGTIEQLASDAKTELGDNDIVKWNPGDKITVNGQRLIATLETPGTTTGFAFEGEVKTLGAPYTAYYPASIYNGGTPTLPAVQQYTADRIDNLPMYAYSSNSPTLQFHNICGVVELTLKGDKKVRSIDVSSESTALCGAFTVTNNAAVITAAASDDNKKVTLYCGAAGAQLNAAGIKFWVAIPAGNHQLKFRVNATDGSYSEFTTNSTKTVEANHIYAFVKEPGFEESVASGPFMVADGRTLYFAKGNLTSESNSYKFYDDQLTSSDYDGTFQWNTVNTLAASQLTIEGHEWNVPTVDDWNVIIGTSGSRPGSNVNGTTGCRYALAQFGVTKGLLLCPDGKDITIDGLNVTWNSAAGQYSNPMDVTVWTELEKKGFVFLPKVGRSSVCYYWSSTQVDNTVATALKFGNGSCLTISRPKSDDYPVRMVLVQ